MSDDAVEVRRRARWEDVQAAEAEAERVRVESAGLVAEANRDALDCQVRADAADAALRNVRGQIANLAVACGVSLEDLARAAAQ